MPYIRLVFLAVGVYKSNVGTGTAKHSLGYPTPQLPNATPETQLTEIVPAQTLVELVNKLNGMIGKAVLITFQLDWIIWLLMIPANGLIKLSAIFLYRRLFVVNKGMTFDIITKVFIVMCSLWTVAFWFATLFGCGKHFTNPWKPLIFIMECNTNMRLDALMISDLITDIMVWLLPMPVVSLNPCCMICTVLISSRCGGSRCLHPKSSTLLEYSFSLLGKRIVSNVKLS